MPEVGCGFLCKGQPGTGFEILPWESRLGVRQRSSLDPWVDKIPEGGDRSSSPISCDVAGMKGSYQLKALLSLCSLGEGRQAEAAGVLAKGFILGLVSLDTVLGSARVKAWCPWSLKGRNNALIKQLLWPCLTRYSHSIVVYGCKERVAAVVNAWSRG